MRATCLRDVVAVLVACRPGHGDDRENVHECEGDLVCSRIARWGAEGSYDDARARWTVRSSLDFRDGRLPMHSLNPCHRLILSARCWITRAFFDILLHRNIISYGHCSASKPCDETRSNRYRLVGRGGLKFDTSRQPATDPLPVLLGTALTTDYCDHPSHQYAPLVSLASHHTLGASGNITMH